MCDGSLVDTEKTLSGPFGQGLGYSIDHGGTTLTSENDKGIDAVAVK